MKTIRKLLLLAAFLFHILMIASASDREIKVIQINQKRTTVISTFRGIISMVLQREEAFHDRQRNQKNDSRYLYG